MAKAVPGYGDDLFADNTSNDPWAMHIGDAASNKRWAEQREKDMKLMGLMDAAASISQHAKDQGAVMNAPENPPMPGTAVRSDIVDRLADALIALINSKPQSPRKEEIAEVVTAALLVPAQRMMADADALQSAPVFGLDQASKPDRTGMMQIGGLGQNGGPVVSHHCHDTKGDPNPRCDACGERSSVWDRVKCHAKFDGSSDFVPNPDAFPRAAAIEQQRKAQAAQLAAYKNALNQGAPVGGQIGGAFGLVPFVPGYRDQDGQIIAFKWLTQYDGPKMATYQAYDGKHYAYQTFAWKSRDPAKIVARLAELSKQIQERGGEAIVWRMWPDLTQDNGFGDGQWSLHCRLHTLPYLRLDGAKGEGEETPEA